ncbi:MAG: PIN domain-containing protein [Gammaproteobacteria bacterium]|nr:PIN domain-containing protein [Gammaproteobacteria bacterium]
MLGKRTYLDASVLIAACQGRADVAPHAFAILDDPDREFVSSGYLELEILPKPIYRNRSAEVEFMRTYLAGVVQRVGASDAVVTKALEVATAHDLASMDALHIACCYAANVAEFVTVEKRTKPFFRISDFAITSITSSST